MTNLIEILKDCPKGRKLYSPLYGEVELDHITDRAIYAKYPDCVGLAAFNSEGQVWGFETGECMLFPSSIEKSWKCWQPVLFEKGDIIHMNDHHDIAFLYDGYDVDGCYYGFNEGNFRTPLDIEDYRFATEDERQQFLNNMEAKGYEVTPDNRVVKTSTIEEHTQPEPIKQYNHENLAKELETIFNNYGVDTKLNMRDYLIADHIIKYIDNLEELLKQQKKLEE